MKIRLTKKEREELESLHKKTKERKLGDRIKAILLLDAGYSGGEVAKILLLDEDTITTYKKRYMKRGELGTAWIRDKYIGRSSKLTKKEEEEVVEYVSERTISDSKEVIKYIKEKFNKEYSTSGIVSLLKRIGFVYKNTVLVPAKYDATKQKEFKEQYEKIEEELPETEVCLFMDGVHPQHNTTCTKAWIKKGKSKEIKSNTGRDRININGAYNPHNGDLIVYEDKTINADTVIETLKKVEIFYQDKTKIYIIVDNARYYYNKEVKKYLEYSKIEFIFLPAYSPNLNLIERVWKYLRKYAINNQYYETFNQFKSAVFTFFDGLPNNKDELIKFVGTKMHLLSSA